MKIDMPSRKNKKKTRSYPLNQSALYMVGSKRRLADILRIELRHLLELSTRNDNYTQFHLDPEFNPFSLKYKKRRGVQQPKPNLRAIHERILSLLNLVQVPDYVHACVKGRSYRSNAFAHKDSKALATYDISSFYASTPQNLVYDFFHHHLKCASDVAGLLASICCFQGRLPTGSPLSPLLSFFTAKPMFDQLNNLAASMNLIFTCYVDDLAFSGDAIPTNLQRRVAAIVKRHGYLLARGKSKIFHQGKPKHITGVVIVNGKLSVPHKRFVAVRNLVDAIEDRKDSHGLTKGNLYEKLIGCLNEASAIDPKFKAMAKVAHSDYSKFKLILESS